MILSKLAIRRRITFSMIYLIAVGFGLFGLSSLKLDLYPNITFPVIGIITQYEGVGPEDIENVLTRPLEKTVVSVENVKRISSRSTAGTSVITLEFDWGTDMDQAEIDVRKMIDLVRDYLPDDAGDPVTFAFDPSMQPIQYLAISSRDLGMAQLRRLVEEQIQPRLERINGVASVSIQGGLERQIRILVNPHELAAQGLSMSGIAQVLRMGNLQIPAGLVDESEEEFSVKTVGEYSSVDQIRNTVIGNKNGIPIYLKNVARVEDGFQEQRQIIRNNGKASLLLLVQKQNDANTVQTARAVSKELPKIEAKVGQGIHFETIVDFSTFIVRSINNLKNTAYLAFLMAFLVLLFFLRNIRSSLIVAVSIPISVILTFFVMDLGGLTLNIISMAGLALAIGMLVDNAIVVLENIFRHHESGVSIQQAADEGTSEVSTAIIASTLTTLAVFIPILFVPGIAGVMFNDMAVTIVFSLTTSLIVALTLIPLLSSRFLGRRSGFKKPSESGPLGRFLYRMEVSYVHWLDKVLQHKRLFWAGVLVVFVVSMGMFKVIGGDFLGKSDQSFIGFNVERASGTSLASTDQTFLQLERIVRENVPEATNIYSSFGTAEGFGAFFGANGSNKGRMMITLPDVGERDRSQFEIQDLLREKFAEVPGIKVTFDDNSGPPGMGGEGDIQVKIFGYDRIVAESLGEQVKALMQRVDGVVDVQTSYSAPRPEYQVYLDRDRISALGLSVAQVATTIESSIKGTVVTKYREGGNEYDVFMQLDRPFRDSKADLENVYITGPTGAQIPLANVAKIVAGDGATTVFREDQDRVVTVSCTVSGRDLQSVTRDIQSGMESITFPPDFRWEIGGTAQDQMESFGYLFLAIIAAIFLVYMVMASQFESLLDPFIIMFTIPLALIGVVWGLFLTGTTLSVTALIGAVLLVGIVVNNGIVLVDYINQQREKHGRDLWEAVLIGGRRRLRPILMTAFTTVLSMLPLALELGSGAEIWSPMARAVIGGLFVSTLLTLFLIPTIYVGLEQFLLRRALKKGKVTSARIERPENLDPVILS
ncbi:MAG: efflux RND transporter permease subunit [Candidatus Neomarinimicrobiota bacterium]|nr:MAG: efflux RND transporter permease subunit [Candidatus Neomarinimicrobiota bacterium]